MSQKRLYPHTYLHPHTHPHLHDHDEVFHSHAPVQRPIQLPDRQVSRRGVLGGGLGLAASGLLAKLLTQLGFAPVTMAQDDAKQIYLAPDDHTDYIWSAGETTYRDAFLEMIDWYLDQADEDIAAKTPAPYHSRWNCDGSFWVWTYEKYKSAADFQRLIERIRDGHISMPLNALCVCEGGAPLEAILRGMYYPGRLERRYNLRFRLAYAMENQTLPYGLGALWAGAGAQYSWKGICGCATQVPNAGDREHEIYWWVGADGSRILMKWNSLLQDNGSIGGYAEARKPEEVITFVDTSTNFLARYIYRIIGAFGFGWDDIKTLLQRSQFVDIVRRQSNAERQIYVSNMQDFFEAFEARYGTDLPSLSCSFGNEWDVDCAVMAEVAARAKRAVEKLRGAEALASLVSLKQPALLAGREAARDLAFMNLGLFWEHDWAGAPTEQLTAERIAWQKRIIGEIESYVDNLHTDAAKALGGMIEKRGTNTRFYAFNPLSWVRTDVADFPFDGPAPVQVLDLSSGREVPSQIITSAGKRYLRVLATDVPSLGYKVFEIRPGAGQDFSTGAPRAGGDEIENEYYRLTLANRGAITSLIDKNRGNREFVQANGALNDLGPGNGTLVVENAGVVSVTLRATVENAGPLKHTTRITLFRSAQRIEIRNTIDQNFDAVTTWKFNFNLSNPDVWHEEVGAVIRARLTDDGGHYSPRNARYDWLTLNHFAAVNSGNTGVTLSNADCYFMRLGASTVTKLDTSTPSLAILAGGGVNGYHTIRNQGGPDQISFLQRFALQTHTDFDPVAAMKFALEHQNPLICAEATGGMGYPETSYSFLTVGNPNVLLWALKPADDGMDKGLVTRLWNLSASPATFTLTCAPGAITAAQRATHIETPTGAATLDNGGLRETLSAHQIRTFLINRLVAVAPTGHTMYLPVVGK